MIGLIGAMSLEVEQLVARLENPQRERIGMDEFHFGTLFGKEAVLAVCGPGKVNAALCAQSMILRFHPDWIINLGVAGAGEDGIEIGDLVIAHCAVQHDMDTSPLGDPVGFVSKINLVEIPCDPDLAQRLMAAAQGTGLRVHTGVIATGDQFISDGAVRKGIHDRFHAKAVEMEGAAVAHACLMHGVPCGVLRSISDHASGSATMDYPSFVKLAASHSMQVIQQLLQHEM